LLGQKRLAAFLKAQNYNNRKSPGELLERLRCGAAGRAGEADPQPTRGRAHARRCVAGHRLLDHQAPTTDHRRPGRASRRGDLPQLLSLTRLDHLRRDAAGRDRATTAPATPTETRSPPTPGKHPSQSSPGNARTPGSAGRATSGCAMHSGSSLTPPASETPGPLTATPTPGSVDTTTAVRCGPSAARGAASSGAAGRPEPPMTLTATPACNSTSP